MAMSKLEVKSKDGKKVGSIELGAAITGAKADTALLHRAVVAEEANSRQGTAKTKSRSEVRGGGAKPYRQKKTGRARQGTRRAPHYAHGGMTHALEPRNYEKKLNRKERRAAILSALAAKVQEGAVVVADRIAFAEPRTKDAAGLLKALEVAEAKRVLVVLPEYDETTFKSFRNLPNVTVRTAPAAAEPATEVKPSPAKPSKKAAAAEGNVKKAAKAVPETTRKTVAFSARDVLVAHRIVIAQDALARVEEVWGK
jgi:large subunit ribosomal protein L4